MRKHDRKGRERDRIVALIGASAFASLMFTFPILRVYNTFPSMRSLSNPVRASVLMGYQAALWSRREPAVPASASPDSEESKQSLRAMALLGPHASALRP